MGSFSLIKLRLSPSSCRALLHVFPHILLPRAWTFKWSTEASLALNPSSFWNKPFNVIPWSPSIATTVSPSVLYFFLRKARWSLQRVLINVFAHTRIHPAPNGGYIGMAICVISCSCWYKTIYASSLQSATSRLWMRPSESAYQYKESRIGPYLRKNVH